jgi:hypothetical protein
MAYLGNQGISDMKKKFDADKSDVDTKYLSMDGSYGGTGTSKGHVSGDYRGYTNGDGSIDFSTSSKGQSMGREYPDFEGSREVSSSGGTHTRHYYTDIA